MQALDRLLDPQEVADYFGVPIATIYVWAARGTGPERIRVGRHTRYRLSAINEWLDSQVKPVRGESGCEAS